MNNRSVIVMATTMVMLGSGMAAASAPGPAPDVSARDSRNLRVAVATPVRPAPAHVGEVPIFQVPGADVVDAVVVQSWSHCYPDGVPWQDINDSWAELGTRKVRIDYRSRPLCDGDFTYETLVERDADVLILSDVAGGLNELDESEILAIKRYLRDGHGMVSTFLTFRNRGIVNRGLAPTAGLRTAFAFEAVQSQSTFHPVDPDHPLFARLDGSYVSTGYLGAQAPRGRVPWDDADLGRSAEFVATTRDRTGVIIVNERPTFRTVYVSTMPEYLGGPTDLQFLYNALTFVAPDATQ